MAGTCVWYARTSRRPDLRPRVDVELKLKSKASAHDTVDGRLDDGCGSFMQRGGVTRSLFVGAHARSRSWRRCSADLFCLACQLWMAANLALSLLSCSSSFSHRLSGVTQGRERTLATGGSSGATGTLVGDVPFSGTCQGEVPLLPCVDNDAAEQVVDSRARVVERGEGRGGG